MTVSGIGIKDPEEGLDKLITFNKNYAQKFSPEIGAYLERWIRDYIVFYNINKANDTFFVKEKDTIVKYSVLNDNKNLFASKYQLYLPTEEELVREIEKQKEGAEYLETLGFDKRFCKICEEVNRYSGSTPREKESDILELVDNFGGMLLDRPERPGFPVDEALVLLEYRNMKDKDNVFLEKFKEFVCVTEEIKV